MPRDRLRPDRDRLMVARLSGIAQRRARWDAGTRDEMTAGAAELRSSQATAQLGCSDQQVDNT